MESLLAYLLYSPGLSTGFANETGQIVTKAEHPNRQHVYVRRETVVVLVESETRVADRRREAGRPGFVEKCSDTPFLTFECEGIRKTLDVSSKPPRYRRLFQSDRRERACGNY